MESVVRPKSGQRTAKSLLLQTQHLPLIGQKDVTPLRLMLVASRTTHPQCNNINPTFRGGVQPHPLPLIDLPSADKALHPC